MKIYAVLFFLFYSTLSAASGEQVVEMATDTWPPYYGAALEKNGPLVEITRRTLKNIGYELSVAFIPWKRAVEHSKKGKYQAVLGGYYNKQRADYFWYSDPIATSNLVLFMHKNNRHKYKEITDLNYLDVCVINGYFYSDQFTNNPLIIKIKSNSLKHCFERLIAQRVDMVIANEVVGLQLLNQDFPQDKKQIVTAENALTFKNLYILWTKKQPENFTLNIEFNRELRKLKAAGEVDKIFQELLY
ncbi:substrate-binding periplasmic protein [Psychromonas ossibalaenae]|uniref:substrate-binding periplasmic protein n=1 Tax=Psychromonas ossibalaenae TaxID=444922 RepID=UPI00037453CA|nr:transporter substrate-binding domain-containing protein [Psychromonas ossibalaenae]